jgi:hypothetical protein
MTKDRDSVETATRPRIRERRLRRPWIAGALVAGLIVGGGITYAAVPSSASGQITACYPTTGAAAGQLRVIDAQAGKHCRAGEKSLSWQQKGLRFRGAWSSTATYAANDLTTSSGSAYVAIAASKNVKPPNTTRWALLAARGAAGTPGTPGASAPHPSQVLWVAKTGGDFTTLTAALASISGNDAAHRYVIKVAPGTFDEPTGVDLKDYVDIEGSGQGVTVITATSAAVSNTTMRATGSLHTEVRSLSVESTGTGASTAAAIRATAVTTGDSFRLTDVTAAGLATGTGDGIGVYIATSSPRLHHLTVRASGGTAHAFIANNGSPAIADMTASATASGGAAVGVQTEGSASPVVDGLTANVTGTGFTAAVYLQHTSALTVKNATITSSLDGVNANSSGTSAFTNLSATAGPGGFGVWARAGGTVLVRDSSLSGGDSAVQNGGTLRISNTEMNGPTIGTPTCLNTYTPSFAPFTC